MAAHRDEEKQLRDVYDDIWTNGKSAILEGKVIPEPLPQEGGDRWGMSFVLRPEQDIAEKMIEAGRELRTAVGEGHVWYETSGLHTTVTSLEVFRGNILKDDSAKNSYIEALRKAAPLIPQVQIAHKGLLVHPSGIFITGYPTNAHLQIVRNEIACQPQKNPFQRGYPTRSTAHTSLSVFTQTEITHPQKLLNLIENLRDREIGESIYNRIDLISFEFNSQSIELNVLESVPLG